MGRDSVFPRWIFPNKEEQKQFWKKNGFATLCKISAKIGTYQTIKLKSTNSWKANCGQYNSRSLMH